MPHHHILCYVQALNFALSSEVRSQDVIYITAAVGDSVAGRDAGWSFFKDNWGRFQTAFGSGAKAYFI